MPVVIISPVPVTTLHIVIPTDRPSSHLAVPTQLTRLGASARKIGQTSDTGRASLFTRFFKTSRFNRHPAFRTESRKFFFLYVACLGRYTYYIM